MICVTLWNANETDRYFCHIWWIIPYKLPNLSNWCWLNEKIDWERQTRFVNWMKFFQREGPRKIKVFRMRMKQKQKSSSIESFPEAANTNSYRLSSLNIAGKVFLKTRYTFSSTHLPQVEDCDLQIQSVQIGSHAGFYRNKSDSGKNREKERWISSESRRSETDRKS